MGTKDFEEDEQRVRQRHWLVVWRMEQRWPVIGWWWQQFLWWRWKLWWWWKQRELVELYPAGTGTTMLAALQLVDVAVTPLNFTVLVPCTAPKFAPLIVTGVPTNPDDGFRLAILAGVGLPPPP